MVYSFTQQGDPFGGLFKLGANFDLEVFQRPVSDCQHVDINVPGELQHEVTHAVPGTGIFQALRFDTFFQFFSNKGKIAFTVGGTLKTCRKCPGALANIFECQV